MSTVIDERIVEMRFDNQQFETEARETMNTLSKLKTKLDNTDSVKAFENLDKATRNIHLEGIASGVEALQKRFSVFGLVGIKAVNGVADALLGMTKKLYNATIGQIVSGGIKRAMNIENAHFQLQALLKDEEKVQAVMDDANKAVDGTAYSLDAAAKAASQFAATGIQAGEEMQSALRGIVGVSAMTNSDFESISMIFTTVAGQGRVMGDQLNQLASRGLNAAATMAEFVNGVNDGSKQASEEVTNLVKTFSNGTKVTESDIRELVSKGKISFKLFSESMTEAFADSAEKANETFTGALSNVKAALARIGAGFISPLIAQNSKLVELFNALRVKINEFKKYIVFDEEVGNVMALSKQFTDFVLKMAEVLKSSINNIDTEGIMRDVYYGLEIVKNVFKALWVIVKPALMAMSGLINPIGDGLHTILVVLEAVTSKMIASENVSTAIGEVLKELVSILGTIISLGLELIQKVFRPVNKETKNTSNGFVELLHSIAEALRGFNNWIKTSSGVTKALEAISRIIRVVIDGGIKVGKVFGGALIIGFGSVIRVISEFIDSFNGIEKISNIIDSIKEAFKGLFDSFKNTGFVDGMTQFRASITSSFTTLKTETRAIEEMGSAFTGIKSIGGILKKFAEGLSTSVTIMGRGASKVGSFVKQFATLENLAALFNKVSEVGKEFLGWLLEFVKALAGAGVGGGIAIGFMRIGAGVEAFGRSFVGVSKLINEMTRAIVNVGSGLTQTLTQTQKTLKAYQRELNAGALIKVAGAIAILAAALTLLSFADTKKVLEASIGLSIVAITLMAGVTILSKAVVKTKNIYDVFDNLVTQIGKSVRTKAIGEAVKDIGLGIMMIAGSIIAVALMYKNNASAMDNAVKLIGAIGLIIVGIMTTMSLLGKVIGTGMRSFALASFGVAALSASLAIVIISINKLFKMSLPYDYKQKLDILYEVLFALSGLTLVFTLISNLGHGGKSNTVPIMHLFFSLHAIVSAMQRLFKMDLPSDYKEKLGILYGIFAEISLIMVAMGLATRIAGGPIKAGGTILALSMFLISFVGALAILTLFPMDKILLESIALSSVIVAIGVAINLASKYANPAGAKAIFNMGILIGTLVASIAILSLFDAKNLVKSSLALSAVLLSIGAVLENASKITKGIAIAGLLAVMVNIAELGYILYKLSEQPWQGMLASGVAMALTLKAYAKAFESLGEVEDLKIKTVLEFILATTAAVPLAAVLYGLSTQPWDGMLAAGVAMGFTLQAFAKAFATLSEAEDIDIKQIRSFLLASLAVIPLGLALGVLAHQPWDGMLAAAVALSATLLAFSGCFVIISKAAGIDPKLALSFVAASLALLPIAYALKMVSGEPWQELLGAAASLSLVLVALAGTMAICSFVGAAAGPAAIGIVLLIAFIAGLTLLVGAIGALVDFLGAGTAITRGLEILNEIGAGLGTAIGSFIGGIAEGVTSKLSGAADNLSEFMEHLKPFTDGLANISTDSINGVMMLGKMISSLAGAEIMKGFTKLLGGETDFAILGEQLNLMAPYLKTFAESVKGISPDSVEGAKTVSEIMLALSDSLPRVGGILEHVIGKKKTLTDFALELVSFGPAIKQFSEIVKGVTPEAVEGAAAAGEIMAQLGEKLPKSDGLIQKIFGDKTLAEFAQELLPFGYAIKWFAITVKDVKSDSVEGAANAGAIMARMAEGLPNSGGVLGWLMGENDIDKFGTRLVSYGNSIVEFSNIVSGLNPLSLMGVSVATQMMSGLAEALPNTGDIFDVFTGGQMDFEKFGDQLEKFGKSLAKYSDSISTLNLMQITMATGTLKNLVDMLKTVQGIDQKALSNLSSALSRTPSIAIQEFIAGFQNGVTPVTNAVNQFLNQVNSTILESSVMFPETVRLIITATALAMIAYLPIAFSGVKTEMIKIGEFVGDGLAIGISSKMDRVRTAAMDMAKVVEDAVRNRLEIQSPSRLMQKLAGYTVDGFRIGIKKNLSTLEDSGIEMGKTVDDSLREYMKIHSPSEREIENGEDTSKGFAIGIENGLPDILKSVDGVVGKVSDAWDKGTSQITEEIKNSKVYEVYGEKWKDEGDKFLNGLSGVLGLTASAFEKQNEEVLTTQTKTHKAALKAEETYWEKLLKIKKAGADGAKYKDMDLAKFQQEILKETMDVWKEYIDQLESTRDSVMSTMDLFSEVTRDESVKSKDELKKNLTDQINAYKEYAELLQTLNPRLGDSELGDYIRTLGVDSLDQLKVINSMTDEELTNYSNLYDTKLAYATNIAASQLTDLQKTTEEKLADLFGGMAESVNVFDFGKVFDGTFESLDTYVQEVMIPLQEANIKAAEEASKLGKGISGGLLKGLIDGGMEQVVNSPLGDAIQLAKDEQSANAESLGVELGANVYAGIGKGLMSGTFSEAASVVMTQALTDLQKAGEIHSPSELMRREVGVYLAQGIADGMSGEEAKQNITLSVLELIDFIVTTFNENQKPIEECAIELSDVIREGIVSSSEDLVLDIERLAEEIIDTFNSVWTYNTLFAIGSNIITWIQNGVLFIRPIFLEMILLMCMRVVEIFLEILNEETFNEIGQNVVLYTDDGMRSVQNVLFLTCYSICRKVVTIFRTNLSYGTFFNIGRLSMQGLADGIISKLEEVMATAEQVALMTADAVRAVLEIHSPSRVFFDIGQRISQGMAKGILYSSDLVRNASEHLSLESMSSAREMKNAIDAIMSSIEDFNPEIVLTPVVDLSGVKQDIDEITALFNRSTALTIGNIETTGAAFNSSLGKGKTEEVAGKITTDAGGANYNFVQNNYSPKALRRVEIYRGTQKQIRQFKEATGR